MTEDNDGLLTEEQSMWLLIHQSRCSKLPPEKREFRRACLAIMIRPECRDEFFEKLNEVGIADCFGEEAESCISTGCGVDYREVT